MRHESREVTISGGVSEYRLRPRDEAASAISGRCSPAEIRARIENWGKKLEAGDEGIRATVIGASQYTTQVSGSTIYRLRRWRCCPSATCR